jgi:two-component system, chemotaxis family, protein-glutamate methylesterase/glutaminase
MNFPYGIVVAIHMPKAFTGPYADRLNAKCSITVKEAVDGEPVKPGTILIAPGGMHTQVVRGVAVAWWSRPLPPPPIPNTSISLPLT